MNQAIRLHQQAAQLSGSQKINLLVLPSYMGLSEFLKNFDLFSDNVIVASNNAAVLSFLKVSGIRAFEFPALGTDLSRARLRELKTQIETAALKMSFFEVHYGFYLSNVPALFFIQELSKLNRIYFWNCDPIYKPVAFWMALISGSFRKALFSRLIYSIYLGMNCTIYKINFGYMLGKKFKAAENVSKFDIKPEESDYFFANCSRIHSSIQIKQADIIYTDNISQHFPKDAIKISHILARVRKHGISIAIKPHPTIALHPCFGDFEIIPQYIPMEVIHPFCKVILGVNSHALKTSLSNITSISLFNCLSDELVETLKSISPEIKAAAIRPHSEEEFYEVLERIFDLQILGET